jgi:thioredoxin-dependent peroxiredoxin
MKTTIGVIEINGNPLTLMGEMVKKGDVAQDFTVMNNELKPVKLSDFKGKKIIISVMPSVDTPVCAAQTRRFNTEAAKMENVAVITLSMDLPFALARFCGNEGIENAMTLSDHRDRDFGYKYGYYIQELGLLARGIVVINEEGQVVHVEFVKEVTTEPDYDAALKIVRA